MPTEKLQFAKIVASPTENSWSQVYSAGALYAVVALTKKEDEDAILNVIGKGIINNLEAEFFGLEEKNLESIKVAITNAIESTPDKVHLNLILTFIKEGLAYVYLIGNGEIMIQRNGKIGTILSGAHHKKTSETRDVIAGSGPIKNNDLLLLKTPEFTEIVPEKDLKDALNTNSSDEAAEILSPLVHGKEKGSASAVFLTYLNESTNTPSTTHTEKGDNKEEEELDEEDHLDLKPLTPHQEIPEKNTLPDPETQEKQQNQSAKEYFMPTEPNMSSPTSERKSFTLPKLPFSLPPFNKKYLIATGIILILLIGSIVYTTTQKENAELEQKFQEVYTKAEKEAEEGESLEELNAEVAQDNFLKAKKILEDNQNAFKKGSQEREQIDELLTKVNQKITGDGAEAEAKIQPKEVESKESAMLTTQSEKKAKLATRNDDNEVYYLTNTKISEVTSSGEKDVFENDEDWTTPVGMGAFGSNVYVLDTTEGLLKFVAGANGYGKTLYFKNNAPDLKNATGMAIDASVYVLYKDGKIEKYTRGEKDSFTLSGFKKQLKTPNMIFTTENLENIYVIDKGNSRLVKIGKTGLFKAEYNATILSKTTGLDVSEDEKKAYILTGNKVYEIDIK
jgi:hypothetical protein